MSDEPRDHAASDEPEPSAPSGTDGGQTKPDLSWWKDEGDPEPEAAADASAGKGDDAVQEAPRTLGGAVLPPIPLPPSSARAAEDEEARRERRDERRAWRAREEQRRREVAARAEAERAEDEARKKREAEARREQAREEAEARRRAQKEAEAKRLAEQEAEARRQAEQEAEARRRAEDPKVRLARAQERSEKRQVTAEEERDYKKIAREVSMHLDRDYQLIGLVGLAASGKTHLLRALSMVLKQKQGFEVAEWKELRKALVPGFTEFDVFYYPVSRGTREKWVFVDASGDVYSFLSRNDWKQANISAGTLYSLHRSRALFLLMNLQPGHFRSADLGEHRWMSDDERDADAQAQDAQAEIEMFDAFLLFLRALIQNQGDVSKLADECTQYGLDKALRPYRDSAPKLDIPVQMLFTQADTLANSYFEVAEAIPLSPRQSTVGVAPFVNRHLRPLMTIMLEHARRFRFDFVQSYEERTVFDKNGDEQAIPQWGLGDGELLSCGALPALEFLARNMPATGQLDRFLQRFEIDTRQALQLDRLLRPSRWGGLELPR